MSMQEAYTLCNIVRTTTGLFTSSLQVQAAKRTRAVWHVQFDYPLDEESHVFVNLGEALEHFQQYLSESFTK